MDDKILAALIALAGIAVGLIGRDVIMALVLARKKRAQEIHDKFKSRGQSHRELVRHYSDPLFEAVRSLRARLDEIIEGRQATYLLADTSKNDFMDYKRVSTFYRFAALLGWIRAFRRERSYLDPEQAADQTDAIVDNISRALADGQHVEELRLIKLANLWRVPKELLGDKTARAMLGAEIDNIHQEFVDDKLILSAADLKLPQKKELVRKCADAVRAGCKVDIPSGYGRSLR